MNENNQSITQENMDQQQIVIQIKTKNKNWMKERLEKE